MQRKTWLSRLMVTCWAGHLPMLAWFAPTGLIAEALMGAGPIAHFFVLVLACAASLSLFDCFVNDALPERVSSSVRDYRHVGFMLMSISLFMLAGILGARTGSVPLVIGLSLPGFFAAIVVWPDLYSRHQRALA